MSTPQDQITAMMGGLSEGSNPFSADSFAVPAPPASRPPSVKVKSRSASAEQGIEQGIDLTTTETRLPFEPPELPEPVNTSGRPRRAAAPTRMPGVGPPIRAVSSRKPTRGSRVKRQRTPESSSELSEVDEDEEAANDKLVKARERLQASKRKRAKRVVVQSDSEDEDYDSGGSPEPAKPAKKKVKSNYAG